jgi:hypothetical protein
MLKNPKVRNTAIGIGVAVLVPIAIVKLAPYVRPLARSAIKGGLIAIEKGREVLAELGESMDDLVAEVREDLRVERERAAGQAESERSGIIAEREHNLGDRG